MKSINNTLLLDTEDQWDRKQTTFSALPDLLKTFYALVAGAADIPATRLLGQSPGGLSATGESDLRNYYDMLDGERSDTLAPQLDILDELIWRDAMGAVPDEAYYEFGDLWQHSDKERADIGKTRAETTKIYADAGLIDEQALAVGVENQLIEDGVYPGMEAAIAEIRSAGNGAEGEDNPEEGDNPPADPAEPRRRNGLSDSKSLTDQIADAVRARRDRANRQRGAP